MSTPAAPVVEPAKSTEVDPDINFNFTGLPSMDDALTQALSAKASLKPSMEAKVEPKAPEAEDHGDGEADFKSFVPTDADGNTDPNQVQPQSDKKKGKGNDALREQMKKVNEEKEALNVELAKLKAEREELAKKETEARQRLEVEAKEKAELQGRLTQRDPRNAPQVKAITDGWNADLRQMEVIMAEHDLETTGLQEFMTKAVAEYANAGAPGSETFREKASKVRQNVARVFGSDLAERGMDLVRSGAVAMRKVQDVMRDIQSNLPKYEHEERITAYKKEVENYQQDEAGLFNAPDELRESDPLNIKVILSAMVSGSDEIKARAETAKKIARFAFLPPAPLDPSLLEGKDESQKREFIGSRITKHREAYRKARAIFPEALVALQVLPTLWERVQRLESQLKLGRTSTPKPKLNGTSSKVEEVETKPADITEFQPVNSLAEDIFAKR
jgi:hypothetical protein